MINDEPTPMTAFLELDVAGAIYIHGCAPSPSRVHGACTVHGKFHRSFLHSQHSANIAFKSIAISILPVPDMSGSFN